MDAKSPSWTKPDRFKLVPRHPNKLLGSKWSAVEYEARQRHWIVIEHQKRKGMVIVEAVLTKTRQTIPWQQLRDREVWEPGWLEC